MLKAGADMVYFGKVWDDKLFELFRKILESIPAGTPVICESPALRNFVETGVFVIMSSDIVDKHKNISHLQKLNHVMLKLEEMDKIEPFPFGFVNGRWFYREEGDRVWSD